MKESAMDAQNSKPKIFKVKIVEIFSPCKVSVLFSNYPETCLRELEAEIDKSWEQSKMTPFTRDNMPKLLTFVAVKDNDGVCKRGCIMSVHGVLIEIFLYDYGTVLTIDDLGKIIALKEEFQTKLGHYAAIVSIPGFYPARAIKFPSGEKLSPCAKWSKEAYSLVESWFKDSTQTAITTFKFPTPISIYGDFYKRGSKQSLSTVLCEQKMACVDADKFTNFIS